MVKSFGAHHLESVEGKKALKLAEKELAEMLKLEESAKGFQSFRDFVVNQNLTLQHKNIGNLPYLFLFSGLKLPSFLNGLGKGLNLDYKFSDYGILSSAKFMTEPFKEVGYSEKKKMIKKKLDEN